MFCKKCGAQIDDNSVYCFRCGTQQNTAGNNYASVQGCGAAQNAYRPEMQAQTHRRSGMHCPRCRSYDLVQSIDNSTEFHSEYKGYSGARGCLGYLLFGPLGLLCGASGEKSGTDMSQESTVHWTCRECGTRFTDINNVCDEMDEVEDEISQMKKGLIVSSIVCSVLAVLFAIIPALLGSAFTGIFLVAVIIVYMLINTIYSLIDISKFQKYLNSLEEEFNYLNAYVYDNRFIRN